MIPYAPSTPYQRNATVADLMMQAGNQQAQAQLQKGAVWGRALGNIGDIASGAILDYQAGKAKQAEVQATNRRDQAFMSLLDQTGGNPDPKEVYRIFGPDKAPKIVEGLASFQGMAQKRGQEAAQHLPGLIRGMDAMSEETRASIYPSIVAQAEQSGAVPPGFAPKEYTADNWKMIKATVLPPEKSEGFTLGENQVRFGPDGKQIAAGPTQAPKPEGPRVVGRSLVGPDGKVIYRDPEAPKEVPKPGDNKDDVSFLMNGGTAEKLPISARAAAVAEAKKSGGVDGTGFVPMSGQQQNKFNDLMDLRNKAVRLSELLSNPEVSSRLGPLIGRVTDWTKELPGVGQDTTVKEAFDLFKDLSDSELRKRSGAAISPGEYQRILGFTVASSKQPDSNKTNLNRMISTLTRDLKTLGADKLRVPGEAEPLENGTRVPAPASAPKVGEQRVIQGQKAFWDGKGWVAR